MQSTISPTCPYSNPPPSARGDEEDPFADCWAIGEEEEDSFVGGDEESFVDGDWDSVATDDDEGDTLADAHSERGRKRERVSKKEEEELKEEVKPGKKGESGGEKEEKAEKKDEKEKKEESENQKKREAKQKKLAATLRLERNAPGLYACGACAQLHPITSDEKDEPRNGGSATTSSTAMCQSDNDDGPAVEYHCGYTIRPRHVRQVLAAWARNPDVEMRTLSGRARKQEWWWCARGERGAARQLLDGFQTMQCLEEILVDEQPPMMCQAWFRARVDCSGGTSGGDGGGGSSSSSPSSGCPPSVGKMEATTTPSLLLAGFYSFWAWEAPPDHSSTSSRVLQRIEDGLWTVCPHVNVGGDMELSIVGVEEKKKKSSVAEELLRFAFRPIGYLPDKYEVLGWGHCTFCWTDYKVTIGRDKDAPGVLGGDGYSLRVAFERDLGTGLGLEHDEVWRRAVMDDAGASPTQQRECKDVKKRWYDKKNMKLYDRGEVEEWARQDVCSKYAPLKEFRLEPKKRGLLRKVKGWRERV